MKKGGENMESICECGETRTLMVIGAEGGYIGFNYDSVPRGVLVSCCSCKREWKR